VQEKVNRTITENQKKLLQEREEQRSKQKEQVAAVKMDKQKRNQRKEKVVKVHQKRSKSEKGKKHHLNQTDQKKREAPAAGSTEWKLEHLAHFVEETSGNPEVAAEARDIEAALADGGLTAVESNLHAEEEVVDLLDQEAMEVSPQQAAEDGIEFTNDDMTELHHGVAMEAVNEDTFQGDMMPSSDGQLLLFQKIESNHSTYAWAGTPWPDGRVKYCLSSDLPANAIRAWELSVAQYKKAVPCLTWEDVGYASGDSYGNGRCQESGAIFVQAHPTDGCWSYVGKINHENQPLQIASPGCDSVGTTMHEIAHALGMAHEQARPDRDTYVAIDFDNTVEDAQFTIAENGDTVRPYDILSLMHYGVGDFATDRSRPVITVKPKGYEKYTSNPAEYHMYEIGNRIGLSQTDVDQLADMYNGVVAGGCSAMQLNSQTTCADKMRNGEPFRDGYGDCDKYRSTSTPDDPCSQYTAGRYCCGCGGGWDAQSDGDVGVPVIPTPAPTPPPTPPAVAEPESGSSDCRDSTTYADPYFGDTCPGWDGFSCNGFPFTDELLLNCPVACKVCSPCSDSTTYTDPVFGDSCPLWVGFSCDGFYFSEELAGECPLACNAC
jgi:hypothetical protein